MDSLSDSLQRKEQKEELFLQEFHTWIQEDNGESFLAFTDTFLENNPPEINFFFLKVLSQKLKYPGFGDSYLYFDLSVALAERFEKISHLCHTEDESIFYGEESEFEKSILDAIAQEFSCQKTHREYLRMKGEEIIAHDMAKFQSGYKSILLSII
jgi:hypothetical protein